MTYEPDLYKLLYKKIRGDDKKPIKYLDYQLVMQKQQQKHSFTEQHY